jgi:hypothetical protein
MKEANTTPIEMPLENLFNFALNMKKQQLILERVLKAIPRTAKKIQRPNPQFLESRGVVKANITRKVEVTPVQLLKAKQDQLVISVAK